MSVTVPKSLKKVAREIAEEVRVNYPRVVDLDDVSTELQLRWESVCNHELFWQDANRYMGDVYNEIAYS